MSRFSFPEFEVQDHGTCECCGDENVDLFCIKDYMWVCKYCLENEMEQCDECGELYVTSYVDFVYTEDGRTLCEFCAGDLEDDE